MKLIRNTLLGMNMWLPCILYLCNMINPKDLILGQRNNIKICKFCVILSYFIFYIFGLLTENIIYKAFNWSICVVRDFTVDYQILISGPMLNGALCSL